MSSKNVLKYCLYVVLSLYTLAIARSPMLVYGASTSNQSDGYKKYMEEIIITKKFVLPDITVQFSQNIPREQARPEVVDTPVIPNKIFRGSAEETMVGIYSQSEIRNKICQVFVENCDEAIIIARYESGLRTNVISPTNDWGLFQINCRWHSRRVQGDCSKLLNPDINISIAKQIYLEQGWQPWATKIYLSN